MMRWLAAVRYTAGMVWFNELRDEWLQMRRTVMRIAPVAMATDVNNLRSNEASSSSSRELTKQLQQLQQVTDGTDTEMPPPPPSR